jgi:hypothetical protein
MKLNFKAYALVNFGNIDAGSTSQKDVRPEALTPVGLRFAFWGA